MSDQESTEIQLNEQEESSELRWGVRHRLEFIEFRLYWGGTVNRSDLMERFNISINQASGDLSRYQVMAPDNIQYDKSRKCYRAAPDFKPVVLTPDSDRYLAWLRLAADGIVADAGLSVADLPPFSTVPAPRRAVPPETLRIIVAAIWHRQALAVRYQSMTSATLTDRWIEPHALAFDGFRWHARSWCRRDGVFKDFVLGRILCVTDLAKALSDPAQDAQWQQLILLEIVPHRGLSPLQRAAIERDYGMEDGVLRLTVREALLSYAERRLGLDIDPNHRSPEKQHIEIRQRIRLQ
jgi:WYL domain